MLRDAVRHKSPPPVKGRVPKIYYATQVGIQPPTIVLFCSAPKAISKPYQRYLLGKFRDDLVFDEVPIKLYLRRRHSVDTRDDVNVAKAETPEQDLAETSADRPAATSADA